MALTLQIRFLGSQGLFSLAQVLRRAAFLSARSTLISNSIHGALRVSAGTVAVCASLQFCKILHYRIDDLPAGSFAGAIVPDRLTNFCRLSDTRDASIQILPECGLDTLLQDLPNLSHVEIFLHQPLIIVNKFSTPYVRALSHSPGVLCDITQYTVQNGIWSSHPHV